MYVFYLSINKQFPVELPGVTYAVSNNEYTYAFFTREDRTKAKKLLAGFDVSITEEFALEVDQDESGNYSAFSPRP